MENKRFGRLVVTGLNSKDAHYNKRWDCLCDCGNTHIVLAHQLKAGRVKSCGCLGKELREASEEQAAIDRRKAAKGSYLAMVKRCHLPTCNKYYSYGARGITVCDRWRFGEEGRSGFECFFIDMGPKPVGYSIDRVDNAKGYTPDNCRWATALTQSRNRDIVPKIYCDGEFLPWMDVVERLGLDNLLARVNTNTPNRLAKIKTFLVSLG